MEDKKVMPLPVINKYEIFIARLDIALERFPSSQKFAYRKRVDNVANDVWENLIEAEFYYKKELKSKALNQALLNVRKLQALLRVSKERGFLGYITKNDMRYITQSKDEKIYQRKLSEAEKIRKAEAWANNALMEYFKLSKILAEVNKEIMAWQKSIN